MTTGVQGLNNRQWVAEQYKTPRNLDARIQLHKRFATNPYPWSLWVFDQLRLERGMRVLEIGGGPGGLWHENRHRLPAETKLIFTDQSSGMVAQARATLGDLRQFSFGLADAQALPFAAASFDLIVANHMLYHLPNRPAALAEIRRVLRPTGRFFAATNDRTHMRQIADLAEEFMPNSARLMTDNERFPFDVATTELSRYFGQIQLHRYANELVVTDADALADYILSGVSINIPAVAEAPLRLWLHNRISSTGAIRITPVTGLFEATSAA